VHEPRGATDAVGDGDRVEYLLRVGRVREVLLVRAGDVEEEAVFVGPVVEGVDDVPAELAAA